MKEFFGLRGTALNYAIVAIAGIDFLLFGYDQGVMGGLLTLKSFLHVFPEIDVQNPPPGQTSSHTSTIQGATVSSYNLGCFGGSLLTIWLGNILGRKRTIMVATSIMIIGASLEACAFSLGHFIAGRVIMGFGTGMTTSTIPTWTAETSKSHNRGKMVYIPGMLVVAGVVVSYWIDFGFSFLEPSQIAWRFPIAFQNVFCIFILFAVPFLPESPRWLLLKGREEEARHILATLHDKDLDDTLVNDELIAMKESISLSLKTKARDLFKMGPDRNFHRVCLAYLTQVLQQLTGINLITNSIGLSPLISRLLAGFNQLEYLAVAILSIFLVERFGRRRLFFASSAGMVISMAITGGCTSALIGSNGETITRLGPAIGATIFLFGFNSAFAIGWLSNGWLYPTEVVPLPLRAPANALSTSANWLWNFVIVQITPVSFNNIGWKTYIMFAIFNAVAIPIVYFFFPETSARSLEEMDEIFHQTTSIFDCVRVAREKPHRYGKKGELLISFLQTEEHQSKVEGGGGGGGQIENSKAMVEEA